MTSTESRIPTRNKSLSRNLKVKVKFINTEVISSADLYHRLSEMSFTFAEYYTYSYLGHPQTYIDTFKYTTLIKLTYCK